MSYTRPPSPEIGRLREAFANRRYAYNMIEGWREHEDRDGWGVPALDRLDDWEKRLRKYPLAGPSRDAIRYRRLLAIVVRWREEREALTAAAEGWLGDTTQCE